MSNIKTHRPIPIRPLLAVFTPVMLAVAGFAGMITLSMFPSSPSEELFDLHQRVQEARAVASSERRAEALDRAATTLEAARRAIAHQREKSWRLRSYDRARTLLWQAESLIEGVEQSPPSPRLDEPVPAG